MKIREDVRAWVADVVRLCRPERVEWCDGSEAERERLTERALREGQLLRLNEQALPRCYLHRSHPSDVARTEQVTYICTPSPDGAGPTNNWREPSAARAQLTTWLTGAMAGRTLYVLPFVMGAPGSPFARVGVQLTDSVYVALSMRIMTRLGDVAWRELDPTGTGSEVRAFTRCLHSLGDLEPERRAICHFPQDDAIWSVGSGYGGNALLGKKCLALRIASAQGRREGWLAEHMMIVGIQSPNGQVRYVAGAFPSQCGKTNLAMLVPPPMYRHRGWRVFTIGDDIAWLRPGADGRLWAVNPEAGFFGVCPGTSWKTNPNAMATIAADTIYTNVALRPDRTVWWEGHDDPPAAGMLDWQGRPWIPSPGGPKAAHPNSRFTVPAARCPSISPAWERPEGVPLSAILFGARRPSTVPLVYQARDWIHGTFVGATLASETTAAATGQVGVLRRDPMAMLPFCGYDMADYFGHWLDVGARLTQPPQIFGVNWFRTGADGSYLWPGYAENLRVLQWVLDRCDGRGGARDTPIGWVPSPQAIERTGIDVSDHAFSELLTVDRDEWAREAVEQGLFFEMFEGRLPRALREQHNALRERLNQSEYA